ncbi:hypothetical protein HNR29_003548 [Rhizobium leguminosarum]|nr:hypothetical protein [Rhizobium leguminosarum]
MHDNEADDDQKPDLLVHYRPVAIRAVAAALTFKRDRPDARPLRETNIPAPLSQMMRSGTMSPLFHLSARPNID